MTVEEFDDRLKARFSWYITINGVRSPIFPKMGDIKAEGLHNEYIDMETGCYEIKVERRVGRGDSESEALQDLCDKVFAAIKPEDVGILIRNPTTTDRVIDAFEEQTYWLAHIHMATWSPQSPTM